MRRRPRRLRRRTPTRQELEITNSTTAPVTVIELGANKKATPLHVLPPKRSYVQRLSAGTALGFGQNRAWLGDAYRTTGAKGEALSVPYHAPAAAVAGPEIKITNASSAPVKVIAVAKDLNQTPLRELPPGQSYLQPAPAGTLLSFGQNGAWLGDAYKVTGVKGEAVSVPYHAPATQRLRTVPKSRSPTPRPRPPKSSRIRANQQQTPLRILPPGQTVVIPAPAGTLLSFGQNGAWLGDAYKVTGAKGEAISLPYHAPAAEQAANGPGVRITNTTAAPAKIIEIGANKKQTPLHILPPGQTFVLPAAAGTLLRFGQNGAWLGDPYKVKGAKGEAISLPFHAPSPETAAANAEGVRITNTTAAATKIIEIGANQQQTALRMFPPDKAIPLPRRPGRC